MIKILKQPHALKCAARTRSGGECKTPAVKSKNRCRMHGGAKGSGAPQGNKNAFKHGVYTGRICRLKELLKRMIREPENAESLRDEFDRLMNLEMDRQCKDD